MDMQDKRAEFKKKFSDRMIYLVGIVLIGAISAWGIYQYRQAVELRRELDGQYNRSFHEMAGYVNNVETLLAKSMVSTTTERTAITLQEAWRQATLAQTNLGQLPVSQPVLASTSKFLAQVGDMSLSLDNQNIRGKQLDKEQYETVEKLYKYSLSLNKSLKELQNDLGTGKLKWGELTDKGTRLFSKTKPGVAVQKMESVGDTFVDYPTLIYDGPFSDHMSSSEAKGLTGDNVTVEQAAEKLKDFFGADRVQEVTESAKSDNDPIKTFSFNMKLTDSPDGSNVNAGISQKGGHIVWLLYNREVGESMMDMDQAKQAGLDFLKDRGYDDMVDTYYMKQGNTATINYAYSQGDVTVYPDLIKLKIALDNGEIVGIESKTYLSNHTQREIPQPKISMEEARKKINGKMEVNSSGLAIIPTNYKKEIFCYEFKGRLNNNDFIVYINAATGNEEEILMIVNTPNGVLTI